MRFVLLVEGSTERNVVPAFLHKWLDPKLSKAAGIQAVLLRGTRIVRDMHRQARLSLEDPRGDVIAVIALLDLYGSCRAFSANRQVYKRSGLLGGGSISQSELDSLGFILILLCMSWKPGCSAIRRFFPPRYKRTYPRSRNCPKPLNSRSRRQSCWTGYIG